MLFTVPVLVTRRTSCSTRRCTSAFAFTANKQLEETRETCLYLASVELQFPLLVQSEEEELGGHPGANSSPDPGAEPFSEGHPVWLNSLVGRIFWDFLREKYWTDQVAQKIQKKLSKIKVKM